MTLTFLCYNNPQYGIGRRNSFVEVFIIVDWEEISMDVSVFQQHLHTVDVMDVLEEVVELLEATKSIPLQTKATVLCLKLHMSKSNHQK